MAFRREGLLVGQHARHHAADRIRDRHGRDLAAGQHEIAQRQLLVHALLQEPLVHALIVAADQDQMVVFLLDLPGHLLVEGAAAGGHVDGVYPLARFIADVLPAAVQGVGLHHRAPAAAVGIVVHLHLLVGGIVPDLVGGDGDIAPLLRPADDGLIHHGVDGVGEQRHNVNSHQQPVLSSCVPAPRPRRCPPTR